MYNTGAMPSRGRHRESIYPVLSYCKFREASSRKGSLMLLDVQTEVLEVRFLGVSGLGRVHTLRVSGQAEASTTEGKAGIPG